MSTLRVNTITDTSGGSSSLSVPGAAKAWVNFNGTGTVAIRASLNVSSITDNGVGNYTVNLTNALADANYSVSGMYAWGGETAAPNISSVGTTSFNILQLRFTSGVNAYTDSSICCYSIFR